MPLIKGNSKKTVSTNISEFHTGKTYAHTAKKFGKKKADKQAIAVALSTARKYRKADGGDVGGVEDRRTQDMSGYAPERIAFNQKPLTQGADFGPNLHGGYYPSDLPGNNPSGPPIYHQPPGQLGAELGTTDLDRMKDSQTARVSTDDLVKLVRRGIDLNDMDDEQARLIMQGRSGVPMPKRRPRAWNQTTPDAEPGQVKPGHVYTLDEARKALGKPRHKAEGGGDLEEKQKPPALSDADQAAMMPETYVNPAANNLFKGVVEGTAKMIAQPGQAMKPNPYPEGSEEAFEYDRTRAEAATPWAAGTALNMLGTGTTFAKSNSAGIAGGKLSASANLDRLNEFYDALHAGKTELQAYKKTGWFHGADGNPNFWIPDYATRLGPAVKDYYEGGEFTGGVHLPDDATLSQVWSHPKLYKAYPELKDMPVLPLTDAEPGLTGYYDPHSQSLRIAPNSPEEFLKTIAHETTHAIQHIEGFSPGASPNHFLPENWNEVVARAQSAASHFHEVMDKHGIADKDAFFDTFDAMLKGRHQDHPRMAAFMEEMEKRPDLWKAALQTHFSLGPVSEGLENSQKGYFGTAGESQARDTEHHLKTHPVLLKKNIPKLSDVTQAEINTLPPIPAFQRKGEFSEFMPEEWGQPEPFVERKPMAKGGKIPPQTTMEVKKWRSGKIVIGAKGKARRVVKKYAAGGKTKFEPKEHEFINFKKGGMIDSDIPGRSDYIPMKVSTGAYVLPADIPSALGQGNSKAGKVILDKMFTSGPYGLPLGKKGGKGTSGTKMYKMGFKDGGATDHVPIIAAGGEYIIHPDTVAHVGHGSMDHGHKVLDRFVLHTRKENIKTLKGLKPPK